MQQQHRWGKLPRLPTCTCPALPLPPPTQHAFILTEPPLNTPENREYTAEIMCVCDGWMTSPGVAVCVCVVGGWGVVCVCVGVGGGVCVCVWGGGGGGGTEGTGGQAGKGCHRWLPSAQIGVPSVPPQDPFAPALDPCPAALLPHQV